MVEDEFFRQLSQGALADPKPDSRVGRHHQPGHDSGAWAEAPREEGIAEGEHPFVAPLVGAQRAPRGRRSQTRTQLSNGRQRTTVRERRPARLRVAVVALLGAVIVALAIIIASGQEPTSSVPVEHRRSAERAPAGAKALLRVTWRETRSNMLSEQWKAGASKTIVGRLLSPKGKPIAGASISVLAADASRSQQANRTVGELRTDRTGRFATSVALDRGAPRKRLTFIYLAERDDTVPAARAQATLAVYAPASASAAPQRVRRGEPVVVRGRSAPGAKVRLLISQPTEPAWRRLTSARADGGGRWKATVRISRRSPTGTYGFRARIAGSQALGFLAARSRPVYLVAE